ncbi:MAG: hypothetical protein AB1755_02020 [Candidatus Omnitrophota bacterium]
MVKKFILSILLFLFMYLYLYAADTDTERRLREIVPPAVVVKDVIEEKDKVYYNVFYEPNRVLQGATKGRWIETTGTIGYGHKNIRGYFSSSQLKRIHQKDYIASMGAYLSFKDSYVHFEGGGGWNLSFIYKSQFLAEYGHKIIKNLYGQLGYTFKGYSSGNTHIVLPGLIYYFGDSYISGFYGTSAIEGRGLSFFGSLRGDFALTSFLKFDVGVSYGSRLYDIYGFDASEELGYIINTGFTLKLCEGVNFRAGYTNSMERPKFFKKGANFSLAIKF